MIETRLTWVNLRDPTTNIRNKQLKRQIRSHVTKLQHARKQGTGPNHHSRQVPVRDFFPTSSPAVEYEAWPAWPSGDSEWAHSSIESCDIEEAVTQESCEIGHRSQSTTFTSTYASEISSFLDYDCCPSPRLLYDPNDELDFQLRRLGSNVSEVFVGFR